MVLASGLLATCQPQISPSKPKIYLKMPSWILQERLGKAQDGSRWAQDGASWACLGPILGPRCSKIGHRCTQDGKMLAPDNPFDYHKAPKICKMAFKTTIRPPNTHLESFLKARCLQKLLKKNFSLQWFF